MIMEGKGILMAESYKRVDLAKDALLAKSAAFWMCRSIRTPYGRTAAGDKADPAGGWTA